MKDAARRAAEAADAEGVDIAKLAIMDAVRQPDVATSLIGFATPQQVRHYGAHVTAKGRWNKTTLY